MKTFKRTLFSFFVLLSVCSQLPAQSVQPFREGDRAVFLGNSITDGGHYHSYIWLYYMTRFPEMNLRIWNAGIGGDTAYDMYKRLDGDVFSKQPTVLMVTFGMNDTGYAEYNGDNPVEFGESRYRECYKNYQLMEQRLKGLSHTRIVQVGTSPYDETAAIENTPCKGKNAVIRRVVEFQKESAVRNGWEFTDFNQPMVALNERFQQEDPSFSLCGTDRIHPDNDGHMVMAYLFLKAQGFAGKEVARVELDAKNNAVVDAVNCEITDVRKNGKDFRFDYLAYALPYPMDTVPRGWGAKKAQAAAAQIVPFIPEMNREILKVTGLSGTYKLLIDGQEAGVWSGARLAKGVNLAEESKTPQYQQALAVMHLNEARWELEREFRQYAWIQFGFFQGKGLLFANNRQAIEVMDSNLSANMWLGSHRDLYSKMIYPGVRQAKEKQMEVLISAIYSMNKPVRREVVLRKIR